MTNEASANDTSTLHEPLETQKEIRPVDGVSKSISDTPPDDSHLAKVIRISAHRTKKIQVPYNVSQEENRRENRIANLGLPPSSTCHE